MGLYLVVFDGDEELEGVEVGSYADFGDFRDTVARELEGGIAGSRFPTLMGHSDCEGSWSVEEVPRLEQELAQITRELRRLPPRAPRPDSWQASIAKSLGIAPRDLCESFYDVDGEPLLDRLVELARTAQSHGKKILFQ